ncbi:MAG TPA: GDP-fucose synthetase [Rhodospirillaceae bacterium]|nr:MAG: GDP-fucose synthetase [Alphaproteobacteria bacterium GWF2_58_20]HAU28931.1 GDP-fucose synthetase [Rhodospirillaceae bacterium]
MMETPFALSGKKVWVAGHRGLVGSAVVRRLERENCTIITAGRDEVDLRRQAETEAFVEKLRPDVVVVAAAKVGGILANTQKPADFISDNLAIELNVINASFKVGVSKLLFLGSSCIYPKMAPQPIPESALLTGPLEPTNEWYAIAKIAGIKLCQAFRRQHGCDYISAMPTNLYGPGDNFDLNASHVLPALMVKIHNAKQRGDETVTLWGTGTPLREFLHVDDLADALVFMLANYSGEEHLNVGFGSDVSIRDVAGMMAKVIGYEGTFVFDTSKPDGTPKKLMDSSRLMGMGWKPQISLEKGLADTYRWFLDHVEEGLRENKA